MPLSEYYGGKGRSVMNKMKKKHGEEVGERMFYATANKMKEAAKSPLMRRLARKEKKHG